MIIRAALALLLLGAGPAASQGLGLFNDEGGDDPPIEIEADEGIEWRRDDQQYVARGSATATRRDVTLFGDVLIAHYRDEPAEPGAAAPADAAATGGTATDPMGGGSEIYRLEAIGNVVIASPTERAQGDRGIYDVDEGVLVLTGRNLQLTTPTDIVTARDSLEYWERRNIAVARGNAIARRGPEVMRGEVLQAFFRDGEDGQEMERVEGFAAVCVDNGADVARGDYGRFDIDEDRAVLEGNVILTSGPNILRGGRAEMDMRTGISRLLSDGRRVSGIIAPRQADGDGVEAAAIRAQGCL